MRGSALRAEARPLLLALVLTACRTEPHVALGPDLVHPDGLVAAAPAGWDARVTARGFAFAEAGDLRSPREVALDLVDAPPNLPGAPTRWLDGANVAYVVTDRGVGSGGTMRDLVAVRPLGDRFLVLHAFEQSEGGPRFDAAWAVLEHADVQ